MGWFDEQIKQRKENDSQVFSDSFIDIAAAITGNQHTNEDSLKVSGDAILTIIKSFGYKVKPIDKEIKDFNEQLEYYCRPYGLMRRTVKLTSGWYKDAVGSFLAFKEDGSAVAIIPGITGYQYIQDGKGIKITKKNEGLFKQDAICFYKPFPNKKLNSLDLIKYAFETRSIKDQTLIIIFMIVSSCLGLLLPKITFFLYQDVVENKSVTLLISTIIMMICVNISTMLFNTYQSLYNSIVSTKMNMNVQSATMMRILSLPARFFRKYSSGDLSARAGYLNNLCSQLMNIIFTTGFSSLLSLVYIGSIFEYAPSLVIPSIIIIVLTLSFSAISTLVSNKLSKETMENQAKASGISYSMLTGIRKIRLAGAEKRAFAKWANIFSKNLKIAYNPPTFIKYNAVFSTVISLLGTLVMYTVAIKNRVSLAEYSAFNAAYGMVFGAFNGVASMALSTSQIKPILEMSKPIMDEVPESSENKEILTSISGNIEMSNVSFRYQDNMPMIVDDMSFKIKQGQYIAIVGKTGCGKSTLIRLLLGFEKPQKGTIYYDGKDINSVDLKSLRRKIGVVMQDGKLFLGDIFSNIVVSAPWLTQQEAFEAADIAGIGDDIREMPMGMNTIISEGGGGISGGQRQRLLIARAIAPKPKILIFDEATSALDNITQKKVSESLDALNCTRIVIAHRLSTIKHCDRILFLEDGKIKEDGTYEELIALNGSFAKLVERQRLDNYL